MELKSKKRTVEFIGLPASGKTTVYSNMVENSPSSNLYACVRNNVSKFHKYPRLPIIFISNLTKSISAALFFVRNTKFNLHNLRILKGVIKHNLIVEYEKKYQQYQFFLDNGVPHFTLEADFKDNRNIKDCYKKLIHLFEDDFDMVILIHLRENILKERLKNRLKYTKKNYNQYGSDKNFNSWYRKSLAQYQIMCEVILESKKPILILDGEEEVATKVKKVAAFLENDRIKFLRTDK